MQGSLPQLKKKGLGLAAVSYDSVAVLGDFAARRGITYPLLSDPESKVIRAFGILNEKVPPTSFARGVPYPGTFIVDRRGMVSAKFFEEDYTERYTASGILVRQFGVRPGGPHSSVDTRHLRAALSSSASVVRGGQRVTLQLEIDLKRRMHVYAPGVKGYRPIQWRLKESQGWKAEAVAFPPAQELFLKAIQQRVPIYQGRLRLVGDLVLGRDKAVRAMAGPSGMLDVETTLEYQACDDKVCYLPEQIPLKLSLRLEGHDSQRVAPELRRPAPKP